jgi:hypothetical protein
MITKLNTYEGVPIGGSNFSDFMDYIRGFLGANFGFSTNALTNEGGFFDADNFLYDTRTGAGGNESVFFTPVGKEEGNFFGRLDTEYFRFNVLTNDGAVEPQVYKWTTLATENSSGNTQTIVFENLSAAERQLPYRPIYKDFFDDYAYGYLDIRLNGIFQEPDKYSIVYPYDGLNFSGQSVTFSLLRLGAESPLPIKDGRYDGNFIDPQNSTITRAYFRNNYDSTLTFEHTNFSLDFGAHVILWRSVSGSNKFSYIPQDLSSSEDVASGTFKVLDYSKGIIKLNITNAQLQTLVFDGETFTDLDTELNFTVISAEQLREENVGGVQYYYTRYGNVYNGESQDAILAEYIFDGNNNIVREIPQSDYFSGIGDLLLQDVNGRYTDGVVLGIKYYAVPNSEELEKVQRNRYKPDTFQFYFHLGLVKSAAVPNTEVRCFLEQNPSSWYNRDVLDSEYFPVNRTNETYHTFLTANEAGNVGFVGTFDPNQAFKIVDTIGLADLNDIGSVGPNQILLRNALGTDFIGSDYTLSALLDTNIVAPSENNFLRYSGGSWINSTRPIALQDIEGNITYSSVISSALGPSTPANVLVSKGYVDSVAGGVGGDISFHVNATDVHDARSTATASRIIIRDTNARAQVGTSTNNPTSTSQDIVNVDWIRANSTNVQTANTLARRDSSGRLRVATASDPNDAVPKSQFDTHVNGTGTAVHGATSSASLSTIMARDGAANSNVGTSVNGPTSTSTQIVNVNWIRTNSTNASTANTLVRRDSSGKFRAAATSSGDSSDTVATKGYVDDSSAGVASTTGIGAYVWATRKGANVSEEFWLGRIISGALLYPAGFYQNAGATTVRSSSLSSGSWRCQGWTRNLSGTWGNDVHTLWVRVS